MIKFANKFEHSINSTHTIVAIDEHGHVLYEYDINKQKREIKNITVRDKSVDTFELPPFEIRASERNVKDFLFPSLGGELNYNQKSLLDRYLTGSIKIMPRCFKDIKKATLIIPDDYSICFCCSKYENNYMGAFNGEVDLTLRLPKNEKLYKLNKYFAIREKGVNVPSGQFEYTLIADKHLDKISEFKTIDMFRKTYNCMSHEYTIKKSTGFKVEYYDPHAKDIENS